MSRPQNKPVRLEFYTSEAQFAALELLTADGLSDRSVHIRQALALYLRHLGINPPSRPAAPLNGAHQASEHA
jgi:hypothetical protein